MYENASTCIPREGNQWYHKPANAKILAGIADFNTTTERVSLTYNGSITCDSPSSPSAIGCRFSTIPRGGGGKRRSVEVGLGGCSWTLKGLELAKQRALKISLKLTHNEFSWQWFDEEIKGKPPICGEQWALSQPVETLINRLRVRKTGSLTNDSWFISYQFFLNRLYPPTKRKLKESLSDFNARKEQLGETYKKRPLSEELIKNCLDNSKPYSSSRAACWRALVSLLEASDLDTHYKKIMEDYKASTDYTEKKRTIPSDEEIKAVYFTAFTPNAHCPGHRLCNYEKWQWLYALLATYGLRIHEAWHIANWDNAVVLSEDGDWEILPEPMARQPSRHRFSVPAFNSPENVKGVLAIGAQTKTGYRLAYPLSPNGENWVEAFNLKGEKRLPLIKNPLGVEDRKGRKVLACTNQTCERFRTLGIGFTPHSLRHAFSHRGRVLNISIPAIATSLGHSERTNMGIYAKYMSLQTKEALLDRNFEMP